MLARQYCEARWIGGVVVSHRNAACAAASAGEFRPGSKCSTRVSGAPTANVARTVASHSASPI
eukprot:4614216-Prymnesium_polylepis.1